MCELNKLMKRQIVGAAGIAYHAAPILSFFLNFFNLSHTSVIVVLPLSLAAEAGDLRYCVTLCFSLFFSKFAEESN